MSEVEHVTKRRGRLQELSASLAESSEARPAPDPSGAPPLRGQSESERLEREWLHRIHEELLDVVDLSQLVALPERGSRAQIREITQRLINEHSVPLSASARARIVKGVEDEVLGLGPLEPLFADSTVADILVNGARNVYVERFGKLEKTAITFRDDAHLLNIIDRIVSNVGRRIDESSPMVDARLADGSRVNAIIPPLAIDGPTMSIRRFAAEKLGMEDLVQSGSVSPPIASLLDSIVRARLNVLVSGGTGSGKTTMLNVLSGFISHKERVVTIEDSAELQLQQPHVIRLEARPGNIEGQGEIGQRELLKNSLRMRPDRIIVGEVRGSEALDMLQAMNTGHDGSLATIHANSPRDACGRLENMVAMAGLTLPMHAVRAQIAAAVDVIVQLERLEDGTRKLVSVQEVQGMEGDVITLSEIFHHRRTGIDADGRVIGKFLATGLIPEFLQRIRERGHVVDMGIFNVPGGARHG